MICKAIDTRYLVRFEAGEKYPGDFQTLARDNDWRSGSISGIGGVSDVVLAYYDVATRNYLTIPVDGIVELVSLSGNLAEFNGALIWHCHATVGDRNGSLKGGHLVGLTVALTLECWVTPHTVRVSRRRDETAGLNFLDFNL